MAVAQGYIIYQDGETYAALGDIDRSILVEDGHADVVFQACVDRLAGTGGGEVSVRQGTFLFHAPVSLASGVSVRGSGMATTLKLTPQNSDGVLLLAERMEEITLADFTCQGIESHGQSAGIILDACGLSEIRSVYARDFSGVGFWVRNNSFMTRLVDNFTSGNQRAGTFIDHTQRGRGGLFIPNKIIGCFSYAEEGHGFEFHRAICQDIVGCVAYQMRGHGYYMHDSTSNLISGCRGFMGYKNGILIENTYEMNISSNIVGWNWGHCLELDRCTWATVSANEFIDAGGRQDPQYGIYMHGDTKGVQVSSNAIFAWWDNQILRGGIYEAEGCQENQITDNVINYYRDDAVFAGGQNGRADFNLGIREPYASPGDGEFLPRVKPEDIRLRLDIIEPGRIARNFLASTRR